MATHTLFGIIYDQFNSPMPKGIVEAFDQDLRQATSLGKSETNAKGEYSIAFDATKASRAELKTVDVYITIKKPRGRTELGRSKVHFNISEKYTLDFKIDGTTYVGLSEFDTLVNTIQPLLEGQSVDFQDLKEDDKHQDISFLNAETQIDKSILSLLPTAFKHKVVTKNNIPADIFYGLFRLQFPTKLKELLVIQSGSIKTGIEEAIKSNIISKKWEKEIPSIIEKFNFFASNFILDSKEENEVAFQTMIKATLPTKKLRKTFIDTHLATEKNPETFWDELVTKPGFTAKIIKNTQDVLRLNLLTNQPVLSEYLYKLKQQDAGLTELRDYTKLTKNDFEKHISKLVTSGVMKTFPNSIEGKTKNRKLCHILRKTTW